MKLRLALILVLSVNCVQAAPPATIDTLDLQRYAGEWYELAKYPNRFQKHCVSDTTANYVPGDKGRVQVVNRCRTTDGSFDTAMGVARRVGDEGSAVLKVRFAPAWLSWLPMVWGDYRVIDLDEDYTLAVVSDSSREYLWILSRTPKGDPGRLEALMSRLEGRGFDVKRIKPSPHSEP